MAHELRMLNWYKLTNETARRVRQQARHGEVLAGVCGKALCGKALTTLREPVPPGVEEGAPSSPRVGAGAQSSAQQNAKAAAPESGCAAAIEALPLRDPLGHVWEPKKDPKSGRVYWTNDALQKTAWQPPQGCTPADSQGQHHHYDVHHWGPGPQVHHWGPGPPVHHWGPGPPGTSSFTQACKYV